MKEGVRTALHQNRALRSKRRYHAADVLKHYRPALLRNDDSCFETHAGRGLANHTQSFDRTLWSGSAILILDGGQELSKLSGRID